MKQQFSYRKLKTIDHADLSTDLEQSLLNVDPLSDLDSIVDQYNSSLASILDKHASLKSRSITIQPSNPWYSPEIEEAKNLRKRLERKWRKTRLEVDRKLFKAQRQRVYTMINDAKASYYRDKISTCTDQNKLTILFKQNWQRNLTSSLFPKSPKYAKNSILLLMLA